MKSPENRKEECFHHVHQYTKHGTGMNQQSYNTVLHTEMQRRNKTTTEYTRKFKNSRTCYILI